MSERGVYMDLTAAKRALGLADTADDTRLLSLLEYASRRIDADTGRKFYTASESRYYTAHWPHVLTVDDLLSVSAIATDTSGDRTYATVWAASDYELEPANGFPKWQIYTTPNGANSFITSRRGVKVTGIFGYGDGSGASPWLASGATVSVGTTSGTALTASSGTPFAVGQTLLVGSEQMYVTAVAGTSLTVERGVNGTTAAIQAAVAASIAQYPSQIREACRILAARVWRMPTFGVQGSSDMGTVEAVSRFDPEYLFAINAFRLVTVA